MDFFILLSVQFHYTTNHENNYNAGQLFAFGMGCVLATILFLAFVALLGTFASVFLNETVLNILNMGVGLVIMYFGIKPFLQD